RGGYAWQGPRSGVGRRERKHDFPPASRLSAGFDQHRPEVVDIGERGAGHDGVAQATEEPVAVMAMERLGKGLSPGADERVGEDDSSRNLGAAINPIGIAGDGVDTGRTVKPFGQAEQEIDVAPASAKG